MYYGRRGTHGSGGGGHGGSGHGGEGHGGHGGHGGGSHGGYYSTSSYYGSGGSGRGYHNSGGSGGGSYHGSSNYYSRGSGPHYQKKQQQTYSDQTGGEVKANVPRAPGGPTAAVVEAKNDGIPTNASTKLFISNCPLEVTKEEIKDFFGPHKINIVDVTWATDKNGDFMGYGWVDFSELATSSIAQKECNGKALKDHNILVSFSQPKRLMDEDPPCEHKDWADWKRLRQKNGLQHFVCIHCGTKWKRATSQKKPDGPNSSYPPSGPSSTSGGSSSGRGQSMSAPSKPRQESPRPSSPQTPSTPATFGNSESNQPKSRPRPPILAQTATAHDDADSDNDPPSPVTQQGSPNSSAPPSPTNVPMSAPAVSSNRPRMFKLPLTAQTPHPTLTTKRESLGNAFPSNSPYEEYTSRVQTPSAGFVFQHIPQSFNGGENQPYAQILPVEVPVSVPLAAPLNFNRQPSVYSNPYLTQKVVVLISQYPTTLNENNLPGVPGPNGYHLNSYSG